MPAKTRADDYEIWSLIHEERLRLGDFLDTLSDAEWEVPSLCQGWQVRDVVAHCVQTYLLTPWSLGAAWIASGLSLSRLNDRGVARRRSLSRKELLTAYRASAPRTTSYGGPKPSVLGEVIIHGGDIARALGRTIEASPRSLITVAEFCRGTGPILHGRQRSMGLALQASDIEWRAGSGRAVRGPLISIILAITGRLAAVEDLAGEGLETLRSRM